MEQVPSKYKGGYSPSKASFARFLVRQLTDNDILKIPLSDLPSEIVDTNPKNLDANGRPAKADRKIIEKPDDVKVCIVGAGISGLYTAMILDSLNIKYEILEANPDRVGGRLYTHYFADGDNAKPTHQYYDIGAMRFPDTPIMARTFDLFERVGLKTGKYIMKAPRQPMRYNDTTIRVETKPDIKKWDPFKVSTTNGGPVPPQTVKRPDDILNDAYFPYRRKIKRALDAYVEAQKEPKAPPEQLQGLLEDLERAWQYLMQHDRFSLRDYLAFVEGQDDESIHWLETLGAGTGWFDQAFSENVLESLAFEYENGNKDEKEKSSSSGVKDQAAFTDAPAKFLPQPVEDSTKVEAELVDWYYIEGGTSTLTETVLEKIKTKPKMGQQVLDMEKEIDDKTRRTKIRVTWKNNAKDGKGEIVSQSYDTVFCSTTFSAMQKMDLTGLELPYKTKAALRSLRYDPSTKVGIQFTDPWWIASKEVEEAGGITGIKGGLGKTDLPLRTCVYPSYNIDDVPKKISEKAVLLCSYTWSSDSERVASMINPVPTANPDQAQQADKEISEKQLMDIMVDNLARLHTPGGNENEKTYLAMKKIIQSKVIRHHAYDWSKDPYTCGGAFALYGPSQFRTLYPSVVRPLADSRLHIIGEAASAHHAWIAGALDSSARAVYLFLERFWFQDLQKKFLDTWKDVGEVDSDTAYLQIALGMVDRNKLPISVV